MMNAAEPAAEPAAGAVEPILALEGISAGYGRLTVLHDINLAVRPGTVDALIGANGAGKTTLLRVASGLLRPGQGTVRVNGADVTGTAPHARVKAGVVLIPEGRGVWPSLSVRDNLRLEVPPWSRKNGIEEALEAFPLLKPRLRQIAGTLSGGQQQMVAMARCFLAEPRVVLLDEPSMGLAPLMVDQIFEALAQIAGRGAAVLLVEQYVNRALEMADSVHLLSYGKMIFSGNASELDEEAVVRGYLGGEIEAAASAADGR
jgi:branched-chain amino acid transport system ATP-binding protein